MSLIKELIKRGVLEEQKGTALEYEAKNSGLTEEEILLDKEIVSEDFLFELKSSLLNIPLKTVSPDNISLKILETIPEESAKYYKMIPLNKKEDHLEVGMVYPENVKAKEALEFLTRQANFTYDVFLITPSNFDALLKKYRNLRKEVSRALEELETEMKEEKQKSRMRRTEVERVVEEAPISKVVAVILRHAVDGKASDIHIEPGRDKVRVRFRLDGILHSSIFLPKRVMSSIVARVKILSDLKIDETRVPQDGRFSTTVGDRQIDFRVSTLPVTLGEKVAIRILDPGQRKIDLKELGLSGRNLKVVEEAIKKPYGMILATGPTGSGKTTTLYAILNLLNRDEVNVSTLEDPVEYYMEGVNQSQIRPEINYTFATGLRSMVRQDPDILMVGEIRDEETASLAIHAALTGHTLLSTLHTSNTLGVIPRLVDMGVRSFLLPPTLSIALAQRLVRRLCPDCKKKVKATEKKKKVIIEEVEKMPESTRKELDLSGDDIYVYEAVGCKKCNKTGYTDRIGIFEIMEMTDQLAAIITERATEAKIKEEAKRQGMITMMQDGVIKALRGETSFEEIIRVAEQ